MAQTSCDHPFECLGPDDSYHSVLTWQPGAKAVWIHLANGKSYEMEAVGDGGFYHQGDPHLISAGYELQVIWPQANQFVLDPYQFQSLLIDELALQDPKLIYREMGAQCITMVLAGQPVQGVRFLVYAPNANSMSVVGDFNHWNGQRHPMQRLERGLWGIFIPNISAGECYKFEIKDSQGRCLPHKADPWGAQAQPFPSLASVVYDQYAYQWHDQAWSQRATTPAHQSAMSCYEVHLGSWKRHFDGRLYTYRELASTLIPYVKDMGFTHIELMPVAEHPFDGSWGYQPVGLFAPTSRYGSADDFKYFVDQCHLAGIGVIMDWVPAHFPEDGHGLAHFDGTPLYHYADPRMGWHPDWHSYIYDYGRDHVRQFLVANALYWFEHFHIDGLRVDAVASMLYRDYSRKGEEWLANEHGGNENLEAISLLKWINEAVYHHFPHAMMIAEESTSFRGVSAPTNLGGLGFGFKWNMGWMHDTLTYFEEDPLYRRWHHHTLTLPLLYAFSENYVLSLSHDEVVHGKGSLMNKMPGDEWQQTANLRNLFGLMFAQPGKKLMFMGSEFGQNDEWDHGQELQWHLLAYGRHQGIQRWVKDLNHHYSQSPVLYCADSDPHCFNWRQVDDYENSVIAFERRAPNLPTQLIVINLTAQPIHDYRLGADGPTRYDLKLNSDAGCYWGSDAPVKQQAKTEDYPWHGCEQSVSLQLPPMSVLYYQIEPLAT
nr:1,4-alpha-glucan branching protein GlgB [Vibrio stylophorae]